MVLPAFGFGAGDFITAIRLINKAAKGLRDTGGAASSYQETALELSSLESVLKRVERLQPTTSTADIVEKIQLCSLTCQLPLARFIQKIKKFEARLGAKAATDDRGKPIQRMRSSGRKLHWAVVIESEASKLKSSIAPQLQTIDLLLQLESLQRASDSNQATNEIRDHAKKLLSSVDELKNFISMKVATQDEVADLTPLIEGLSLQQSQKLNEVIDVSKAARSVLTELQSKSEGQEAVLRDIEQRLDSGPATGPPSQSLKSRQESGHGILATDVSIHTGAVALQLYLILVALRTSITEILLMFLCLLPAAQRFLRSIRTIARSPKLLLNDNIQLEDALGRTMSLPFEHFKYWPVLEARLKEAFVGLPGELFVKENQFHILNMRAEGDLILTKKNWSRAISSGAKLAMSIHFPNTIFRERSCPRCQFGEVVPPVGRWTQCQCCSLTYRVLPRSIYDVPGVEKDSTPDTSGTAGLDRIWKLIKSLDTLPKASDLQHFKRIHVIGLSSEQLGLPEDIYREVQTSNEMNSQTYKQRFQQYDGLQVQTMLENFEMQKAQAFWNPLESMSKKDATS